MALPAGPNDLEIVAPEASEDAPGASTAGPSERFRERRGISTRSETTPEAEVSVAGPSHGEGIPATGASPGAVAPADAAFQAVVASETVALPVVADSAAAEEEVPAAAVAEDSAVVGAVPAVAVVAVEVAGAADSVSHWTRNKDAQKERVEGPSLFLCRVVLGTAPLAKESHVSLQRGQISAKAM